MAGEWVKVRASLKTNPKVNGIARILENDPRAAAVFAPGHNGPMSEIVTRDVMRHITVSSLVTIWSAANEHTEDGVFPNADLKDLDDMVGIPGFGDAMEAVGWAEYDDSENRIILPNFNEWNTPGKSRAAERQKRYRERQKTQQSDATVTSRVTPQSREEKSREETAGAEPQDGSASQPDDPVFIQLPLNDNSEHSITEPQVAEWEGLYPAVDVRQELREMRGWLDANPSRRKTAKGIKRFITNWLSKEQDKGGKVTQNPAAPQPQPRASRQEL